MKRLVLASLCLCFSYTLLAQTSYLEQLSVENVKVVKTPDRKVDISMILDFTGMEVKSNHSVRLYPLLISADGKQSVSLPYVVIDGKTRHRIHKRVEVLDKIELNPDALFVLEKKKGEVQRTDYQTQIPFRRWMLGGKIRMDAYVTGCAACMDGDENTVLAESLMPVKQLNLKRSLMLAPADTVKRRVENRTARLQFKVNSSVVEPNFSSNRKEIDNVLQSIRATEENPDILITGIYITGYASPEGGFDYNIWLSERRARSFTAYIVQSLPHMDHRLFHVDWKGEDWVGFRKELQKASAWWPDAVRALSIIDNCSAHPDICESRLRTMGTASYNFLKTSIYPIVRRNDYRIEYTVRHFNPSEGWEMMHNRPDLMNVYEMQQVAARFDRNSDEYLECWTIAARTYPDNAVALNNAAILLAERGRYNEALALLGGNISNADLLNVAGTIYAQLKDYESALNFFKKAQKGGHNEGTLNCTNLEQWMEYMAE